MTEAQKKMLGVGLRARMAVRDRKSAQRYGSYCVRCGVPTENTRLCRKCGEEKNAGV